MVYLALGVFIITCSLGVYKYRLWANPKDLLPWTLMRLPPKGSTDSRDTAKEDGDDQERDGVPIFTFDNDEPKSKRSAFAQEQPMSTAINRNESPSALSQPHATVAGAMAPPAQRISSIKRMTDQQTSNLMPPPSRPNPSVPQFKAPPKLPTMLRPPPSAASSLRAPPSASLKPSNSSLAPSTSTLAPSARPSRKVLLDPGHSPLDWAHLTANPPTTTFLRGTDVPPNLIRVPPSALRYHNGRKGKNAWGVYRGKVYNLSPYMKFHPGGVDQLMRGAGRETEGEKLFNEIHPWVSWENMLGECLIGILVSENEVQTDEKERGNQMEEMD